MQEYLVENEIKEIVRHARETILLFRHGRRDDLFFERCDAVYDDLGTIPPLLKRYRRPGEKKSKKLTTPRFLIHSKEPYTYKKSNQKPGPKPVDQSILGTLKTYMEKEGITQKDIAKKLQWHQSDVNALLRGVKAVGRKRYEHILNTFGKEFVKLGSIQCEEVGDETL